MGFLLLGLAGLFSACSDKSHPRIREWVVFPETISPIYYLDTISIKSPRIALVDSMPYIFSLEKLKAFENKDDFIAQRGVLRYLIPSMIGDRYLEYIGIYDVPLKDRKSLSYLSSINDFYSDDLLLSADSIQGIPVYKFKYNPETFLLVLMNDDFKFEEEITPLHHGEETYSPAVFSKNYFLALIPIYNKKTRMLIDKKN